MSRALLLTLALLLPALVACTDTEQAAVPPGVVQIDPQASPTDRPGPPLASPVLGGLPRSGPALTLPDIQRIYFLAGSDLYQQPVDNLAAPVITGRDILAFAPSPDGERVIAAFQTKADQPGAYAEQFAIVRADSTVELELTNAQAPTSPGQAVRSIAWSPRGLEVAVARQDGSIQIVGADASVRTIVPPHERSAPAALQWSPDGRYIAYLDPALPGQPTELYTVSVDDGRRHRLVEASDGTDAVTAATWLPGRQGLAYIRSSPATIPGGGDVFEIPAEGGPPVLIASAGQFAPVAGAVDLAASRDGHSLAVSVYVPGTREPVFHSLWIIDLEVGSLTEVPTARGEAVTDLWWASGSLIYRAVDAPRSALPGVYTGTEPFTLYQVDPATGQARERYRSPRR